jgi:DNA-3-methyladenine glycosylase II
MTLVRFPAPLDVDASLGLFRRSGDDLIDRWDGTRLVRTVHLDGQRIAYCCTALGTLEEPAFHVEPAEAAPAVSQTFFTAPPAYADLLERDPALAALDARFPGVRQPRQHDLFGALIRCISSQQVNLRWAVTTRRRLAETFGERHSVAGHTVYSLDPSRIARVRPSEIRALQFTNHKSEYMVAVAQAMADGLSLAKLDALTDDQVIARLTAIRGLGRWSAEWILARAMGRPTVVAGDLGVRKAVGLTYLNDPLPSELDVRRATAHWGEAAGVAQAVLLYALSQGALPVPASARRSRSC